jgi:hypothetical protein
MYFSQTHTHIITNIFYVFLVSINQNTRQAHRNLLAVAGPQGLNTSVNSARHWTRP